MQQMPPPWWLAFQDPLLNQLIATGLRDSPTLKIAQSRVVMAEQVAVMTESTLFPSLNGRSEVTRLRFPSQGLIPPPFAGKTFTEASLGFRLNYTFDWWGRNHSAFAASLSQVGAAQAELAEARLILTAAIARCYLQSQSNWMQLKLAQTSVAQHQAIANLTHAKLQSGIASAIPETIADANLQAAKLILAQSQQDRQLTTHQLAILLGKDPSTAIANITKPLKISPSFVLPKVIRANCLAYRPDILASRWRAEAAAQQVKVAKASFYPNVNLVGLLGLQSIGLNNLFKLSSHTPAGQAAIDLPIFDAGQRWANLNEKQAEYQLAVQQYQQTLLTALQDVADAITRLQALKSQQRAQHKIVAAAEQNASILSSYYQHGTVDKLQLLAAQDNLLQQQSRQINLQTAYLQAWVGLLQAIGGHTLKIY